MNRARILIAIAATLVLGACDSNETPGIQQRVELKRFSSCEQLQRYIQSTAIRKMNERLDEALQSRVSWHGSPDAGLAMPAADAGASSPQPPVSEDPASWTETNRQHDDVDEPDFIKNDGKRIFVLSGQTLYAARSWPPADLAVVGKLTLPGRPMQMFLDRTRLAVFTTVSDTTRGWSGYTTSTRITMVDVSDMAAPRKTAEYTFPGSYRSARKVNSTVRLVLDDAMRWPSGLRYYVSGSYSMDEAELRNEYEELRIKNHVLIQQQQLRQWLPEAYYTPVTGKPAALSYRCSDFYRPNADVDLGLASVISFDMDNPLRPPYRTSVVGQVGSIYASASTLVLASPHRWWGPAAGQGDYTYLHKFDISDPLAARYVASGGVSGTLLNQFAMDEYKGYLRLATTRTSYDGGTIWSSGVQRVNLVTVLAERAGRLVEVGRTEPLARGERIYAVRFQGDRGYIVTFRQVDPLFTLDLGDPQNPRAVGELKVPGFSTYIHPLDSRHLLTMGIHMAENGWSDRSIKLTIFDVSDFSRPTEKFTVRVGSLAGNSEAVYEHKAFNYFADRKLLAIPFSDYAPYESGKSYWERFVSDLRVFRVDTRTGIHPLGDINMKDLYQDYGYSSWGWGRSRWVRRSVMAADTSGQEFVYAVSDLGIRVANVKALSSPLKTARLTP
jgi:uncharacterized secreted protein with C-terminal beta-propeller domain